MAQADGPKRGSAKRPAPPKKKGGSSVGKAVSKAAPKKRISFGPAAPQRGELPGKRRLDTAVGAPSSGTVKLREGTVKKIAKAVDKNASGEGAVKAVADALHNAIALGIRLQGDPQKDVAKRRSKDTTLAAVTSPASTVATGGGRVLDDATDLATGAIPSVYLPAREVARGKPGSAAKMLLEPFANVAKDPLGSLEKHPLQTILLASGAEAVVGRGLGKGLRTVGSAESALKKNPATAKAAPLARKAREAGSTRRPKADTVVPGTRMRHEGEYSRDTFIKMGQKALDKIDKRDGANPRVMSKHQQKRRANETEAAREDTVRRDRVTTGKAYDKAVGNKHGTIKALVQDNTVMPTRESVIAYLNQLEAAAAKMTEPVMLKANKELRAAIGKDLKRADFPKIVEEVRAYRELRRPADEQRYSSGLTDRATQEYAAEVPGAVQHEGARTARPAELKANRDAARENLKARTKETRTAHVRVAEAEKWQDRRDSAPAPERSVVGVPVSAERVAHALNNLKDAVARQAEAAARNNDARAELQHGGYLRAPDGHRFTLAELQALRDARGQEAPAFVTQAPRKGGAKAHRVAPGEAVHVDTSKVRTGAATREGTSQVTNEILREQAIRHKLEASAQEQFTLGLAETALRKSDGELFTANTAEGAIRKAENLGLLDPRVEWIPVRMNPTRGHRRQLDATLDAVNEGPMIETGMRLDYEQALSGTDARPGPYALVPKEVVQVWRDHMQHNPGAIGKAGYAFGSIWRKNVLGFSPKWLTGNIVEANVRAAVAHAGPRSVITAVKVDRALREIDPKAADQLRVRAVSGGNYGLLDRNNIHVEATTRVGKALHELSKHHGPKEVVALYNAWINTVFHRVNGHVEYGYQMAMLGKALRDHPLMSTDLVKTSKAATENVARALSDGGKVDLNLMADLGRKVDDMYGKYGKFSPTLRRAIASYTPFIAWTLNSVKFLSIVLPRDHPVLTALLVSANQATEEWRKDHGLEQFLTRHGGGTPDYLKNSVPGEGGTMLRIGRYTPFGIMASEGGPAGAIDDLIFPQINGVLKNLSGMEWTGRDLQSDADRTWGRNALAAGTSFIESLVPASNHIVKVANLHLPNERDTARNLDGDVWTRLRRTLDPFMYTREPAASGGSSSGVWKAPGEAKTWHPPGGSSGWKAP